MREWKIVNKKYPNIKVIKNFASGAPFASRLWTVLRLTVKEPWFTLMATNQKPKEIREDSEWIRSRLFNKDGSSRHYDFVEITNGYGSHRPAILMPFEGFGTGYDITYKFPSVPGLELKIRPEHFNIFLGPVLLTSNIIKNEPRNKQRQKGNRLQHRISI